MRMMTVHLWSLAEPPKMQPLDFGCMFIGDAPPLFIVEVALRTTMIFVYTLLLLRVLGKRGVAQLSLFEVTIIIGLGSAVGDPMFQPDVPLVHAMVVIAVIIVLYRVFMAFVRKSEMFERFVEGEPSCLVSDGRSQLDALDCERISQEELFEISRGRSLQLGEVKRAFLEQSGALSVYAFAPRHVQAGLPSCRRGTSRSPRLRRRRRRRAARRLRVHDVRRADDARRGESAHAVPALQADTLDPRRQGAVRHGRQGSERQPVIVVS